MKSCLRKVVMSKQVAASYLEKVAHVSATVTVYFNNESRLKAFMSDVQHSHGDRVSSSRGFDYIVFMSADHDAVRSIQAKAKDTGLDCSGL